MKGFKVLSILLLIFLLGGCQSDNSAELNNMNNKIIDMQKNVEALKQQINELQAKNEQLQKKLDVLDKDFDTAQRAEIELLIDKLKDKSYTGKYGDGYTWYTAAESLGMLGKPAVPYLIRNIETKDAYARTLTYYALLLATQQDNVKVFTGGEYIHNNLDFNVKSHEGMKKLTLDWWEKYKANWN